MSEQPVSDARPRSEARAADGPAQRTTSKYFRPSDPLLDEAPAAAASRSTVRRPGARPRAGDRDAPRTAKRYITLELGSDKELSPRRDEWPGQEAHAFRHAPAGRIAAPAREASAPSKRTEAKKSTKAVGTSRANMIGPPRKPKLTIVKTRLDGGAASEPPSQSPLPQYTLESQQDAKPPKKPLKLANDDDDIEDDDDDFEALQTTPRPAQKTPGRKQSSIAKLTRRAPSSPSDLSKNTPRGRRDRRLDRQDKEPTPPPLDGSPVRSQASRSDEVAARFKMTIPIPRNKFGGYEDMLNLSQASAADADGDASGQDVHAETLALTLPASMGAPSTISSATATPSLPSGRAAPHPIVLIDSDDEGASTDSLELADDGTELAPCPIDPNCTARMRVPPTAALQKAIEEYRRCERRFARGRIQREQLMQARLRVCRLHASEVSVIPRGIEQGYPAEIDLRRVRERVEAMRSVFVDILRGRVASPFLEATLASFRNLGVWKAQANETRFSRLSKLQCGYYGWKGGNIIFKTIQALFRGPNAELRKSTTEPQSVVDYIQNVLVPEAALRLIAGDYAIDLSSPSGMRRARGIMDDSAEFGACVNGSVSDSDDSGSASESGHESE